MTAFVLTFAEGNNGDFQAPPPPPPAGDTSPPPPPAGNEPPQAPQGEVNVLMVVLAYLGILSLIPFFAEKEDDFVQYHARQGLTLFIAEIVLMVVLMVISMIPILGCLIAILQLFFWLGVLVYHIILIVRAVKGERVKIPFITMYAERWFS